MILLTGGAGYIGGIVAEKLLAQGRQVVVCDDLSRGYRDAVPQDAVFVEGDIGDAALLAKIFREHPVTAVMHFAALALVGESMSEPGLYFRNNLAKALTLIEQTRLAGVERFIFSSTCAIFGDQVSSPISESQPKSPINPYGESKLAVERALGWYHQIHGMAYFCLRYFNACGATRSRGERHEPETHLIPLVLEAAAGERDGIHVFGDNYPTPDGTCIRDYIHVEDLAEAHIQTLAADPALSGGYNTGVGRGHSVREVIETARRVTGKEIREIPAPPRPGDPPELVADPAKIQRELGWRARRSLEDAIASAWAFKTRR